MGRGEGGRAAASTVQQQYKGEVNKSANEGQRREISSTKQEEVGDRSISYFSTMSGE